MKNRDERREYGVERERGGARGSAAARMRKRREKKDDVLSGRMRKKTCRFCEEKIIELDYKDIKRLERLVSERGKILSRRITGTCAKHQRKVENTVKRARFVALLPFLKQ